MSPASDLFVDDRGGWCAFAPPDRLAFGHGPGPARDVSRLARPPAVARAGPRGVVTWARGGRPTLHSPGGSRALSGPVLREDAAVGDLDPEARLAFDGETFWRDGAPVTPPDPDWRRAWTFVRCLDADTAALGWETEQPAGPHGSYGSPVAALAALRMDGALLALDLETDPGGATPTHVALRGSTLAVGWRRGRGAEVRARVLEGAREDGDWRGAVWLRAPDPDDDLGRVRAERDLVTSALGGLDVSPEGRVAWTDADGARVIDLGGGEDVALEGTLLVCRFATPSRLAALGDDPIRIIELALPSSMI